MKKIGLVLSGGGYRGAAHVGVFKAMEELNIKPSIIAGTSIGAILGTFFAAGYDWQTTYDFLKKTQALSLGKYTFHKAGFFDSAKYQTLFEQYFPQDRFDALDLPLFIATTDLIEGKTKFFYEGELIRPLIASCAVPGVFSPVPLDDLLLCDGGVTNNFPIEPLLAMSDAIIGVYLNQISTIDNGSLKSSLNVLQRAYSIIRKNQFEQKFSSCDVLVSPPNLGEHQILSKNNLEKIFELGYVEALEKLSIWKEAHNIV